MEYKKKFNKNKTKVTITATEGSSWLWDCEKKVYVKEKTLDVVKKEEIYKWMENEHPINLGNKYVKGFSLGEYRGRERLAEHEKITLKDFIATGAFFEGGADFLSANFDGDVNFAYAQFWEGNVDFGYTQFGEGNVSFGYTQFGEGNVSFRHAQFGKGNIDFEYAQFGEGNVDFGHVQFGEGNVDFEYAQFGKGNAHFGYTQFGEGNVSFKHAQFGEGNVDFEYAQFGEGNVDFEHAQFGKGNVDFSGTIFGNGNVIFKETSLYDGELKFDQAEFGKGDVIFNFSSFDNSNLTFEGAKTTSGKFSILGVSCDEIHFGGTTLYGDLDSRVKRVNLLSFQDAILHSNIDFGDHVHSGRILTPTVKVVNFIDTKLYGNIHLDYDKLELKKAIENQGTSTTHKQKAAQFRLFKENFRNLGQYDDEDKAYVQFMYHNIRAEIEIEKDDSSWVRIKKRVVFGLKWLFYEKVGLYGTSPLKVALSMFVVIGLFALLYLPFSRNVRAPAPFFHSIITFLTIGYGTDFMTFESFWFKLFSGIEGFAGLFLMSYFTISFVRKVLR